MNLPRLLRRLRTDRRAVSTVEMAIIMTVLIPLTFAIIDAGMILWVQGALQSTAEFAARCGAISGSACSGTNGIKNYVTTTASIYIMPQATSSTYMTVTPSTVTSCQGVTGSFKNVQISTTYLSTGVLPKPFGSQTITVSACYPCVTCCTSC
jgi:Flp pilus assembly protein TadG